MTVCAHAIKIHTHSVIQFGINFSYTSMAPCAQINLNELAIIAHPNLHKSHKWPRWLGLYSIQDIVNFEMVPSGARKCFTFIEESIKYSFLCNKTMTEFCMYVRFFLSNRQQPPIDIQCSILREKSLKCADWYFAEHKRAHTHTVLVSCHHLTW